jgi:DNA-binding NtrC family response regulator
VRAILAYTWPGNVRELKSTVERAVLIADGDEIQEGDLLIGGPKAVRPWAERFGDATVRPSAPAAPPVAEPPSVIEPPAAAAPHPEPADEPPAPFSGDGMDFPPMASPTPQPSRALAGTAAPPDAPIVPLEDLKRQAVSTAFAHCGRNVERAALELGIGRATMYRLLKKYDIPTD